MPDYSKVHPGRSSPAGFWYVSLFFLMALTILVLIVCLSRK